MFKKKAKNPDKLGTGTLLAWSGPGISNAMHFQVVSYLSLFCSSILGISPALVGSIMLATKVFDCISDLFIGYLVDNTNTKIGRGRPFDLCIIGMWLATLALYACPASWGIVPKCIWLFVVYTLMNSGFASLYAAAGTPYMVRAFNNQQKYVKIGAYGGLISMIGGIAVGAGFPILMGTLATSQKGWLTLVLIFAVPGILLGVTRFLFVKEKYNVDVRTDRIKIKDIFYMLKSNKYIWIVALMLFVYNLVSNMGVSQYYWTYVVGDTTMLGILSIFSVIFLPIMLVFPPLLKKVPINKVIMFGFVMCAVGYGINWFAGTSVPMLMLASAFSGIGVVPISMMSSLLIVDCADYNEWMGSHRMEATLGTVPNLCGNLGSAFGAFLLGVVLEIGGFVESTDGFVQQPDSAILSLRLLFSVIPLVLYIVAAIAANCNKLDKLMPQIHKELAERRAAAAEEK